MIDLSHLTEEEQGAIMTVLRRDAELKKAEEDRISKLEKTYNTGPNPDSQWKYISGEWFYEAKSRRHTDKIHGSEIILASMKAKTAPLDASPLTKRSVAANTLAVVAPPKPARSLENLPLATINESEEKESSISSRKMSRQNPFNRASLIVYEAPNNISFVPACQGRESSGTGDAASLNSHPGDESSQVSDTSDTSDASSSGFRPVPRKRTFLSRRPSNSDPGSDAPASPASVVPAPRRRHQVVRDDSSSPGDQNQQQHDGDADQPVLSESKHRGTPSLRASSSHAEVGSGADVAVKGRREEPEDDSPGERAALRGDAWPSSSARDSDGGGGSAGQAARPDELSLPQSSADPEPPVSYDLNFIDKSDETMKKSNQKNVFTLTTQSTSPAGDEESIAKVLDWFHRSTDRSDWLNKAGGGELRRGSGQDMVVSKSRSEDSLLNDGQGTSGFLQKKIDDANALRAAHRSASTELLEIEEPQQQQQVYVPHLRSIWERHKIGPKVLIIKSMMSKANLTSEPERYSWEGPHGGERQQHAYVSPPSGAEYTSRSRSSQEPHSLNDSARNYRNRSELASTQTANRRGSDAGRQRQEMRIQPRLNVETESMSKSNLRLNRNYQSTDILSQDEPPRAPKMDTDFRMRYSPGSFSSPYKDVSWNSEDQRVQPSASPIGNSDVTNAVRGYNPHRNVQDLPHQDSSTDKMRQLKSFWEQGRKPSFKSSNVIPEPSQSKVNKRFTKSQYDLSSLGNNDNSEANNPNGAIAMIESPNLNASRTQFNNLRQFWDEATSGRPKSTVRTQLTGQDSKCKEPEIQPKTRPLATKSSPSLWKMSTMDCPRDASQQATSGKENRPYRDRKDSLTSSRADSMRRVASMFALSSMDENDEPQMDPNPSHIPSRKQRQKSISTRKPTEDAETPTTRARAHVPRDYRHYLGMTDQASFHGALALGPEDEEEKGNYGFDLGEPVQVSTPVRSEAWHSHKSTQMSPYPLGANYSSDAGPDSSLSSTSDSWSNSKKNSDRGSTYDTVNPIKKALLRAETRSKSLEDLIASPGQVRRHDMAADMRGASDVSSVPSPTSSSLFSDPDHLKKMSKSTPQFLQKEDDAFTDSTSDHSYHSWHLTKGGSLTNLTTSSGLSSLSGSVMTMYSGDLEVQGNIVFSINYIQKLKEFHIFVAQCQDLATADLKKGRSDPYVKSYLVPDKSNLGKRKTSVKKKTLNPTFNEILRYRVDMEDLRTQYLILSVWHHDTFGRNSFLGEVDVDLSKWDFDHTRMNYFPLKSRAVPNLAAMSGRGQIKLAVRYLPQISHSDGVSHFFKGEIHIWVKECRSLPLIRATINPYVKSFVLPDTSRKSRQKTRVVRRTADPVFNHTMVYDGIRDIDLSEACVELTVWDRDKLATSLLGGLRLGMGTGSSYGALVDWMDSTPAEVALWELMKATPNEWVEDVLPLRMLNPAKATFK